MHLSRNDFSMDQVINSTAKGLIIQVIEMRQTNSDMFRLQCLSDGARIGALVEVAHSLVNGHLCHVVQEILSATLNQRHSQSARVYLSFLSGRGSWQG